MSMPPAGSQRVLSILNAISPFMQFFGDPAWASHLGDPAVSDFVFGNPHEMPGTFRISLTANDEMINRALPAFAAALSNLRE